MTKKTVILALALALALVLALLMLRGNKHKPSVKIGVLHSLTGDMAVSEAPLVDMVRMAIEEANQSGGLNGAPIELVVADCRSDANYCAQQAEKLISQDNVKALFGCWTSSCRKTVKTVVEKHHHLLFYPAEYEGFEHSPDMIYTGAAPNQKFTPMVSWAMQHAGKRAYLIGSNYIYSRTTNQIVKKLLLAQGGQLLAERYVPLGEQDMDSIAREIAALHPDFVLNTINGSSNRFFFEALRKAGVRSKDIPVFSTSIAEAEVEKIGPELLVGDYAAWNYFQSVDSDQNRAFIERFHRRFAHSRVMDDQMEASYIGVKLWVKAARRAASLDMSAIKTVLSMQTLAAPEGIVAVDAGTGHLWKPVRIGRARADGQFDIVWQSGRSIAPAPFPFFIPQAEYASLVGGGR